MLNVGHDKSSLNKILSLCMIFFVFLICGCTNTSTPKEHQQLWGQVDATEVDMNSKVAGRVVEMYVEEGSLVKKGEILARIDARELNAQYSQKAALLRAAKAQAAQAKANLELAAANAKRYEVLYNQGAISSMTYDDINTKYSVASAAYQAALEGIDSAEEQKQQVSVNVDETLIRAPFDGIITTKYVNVGAMVSTGMPIFAVQNPIDNWVNVKVNETELQKYFVGQTLNLEGRNSDCHISGNIVSISKKPDFATKRATNERGDSTDIISYNIKIQINSDKIRPGMRFKIIESEGKI
ncbi:MAG: efflux RND transporter periplasmic adaptor subunit [Acidaminococcaceae bacterium]|nr:efflux RND transporter periplasmic adaptor subunit [Acidaminococcaceae bacterium]MDD4721950.1 efflux RND transporter periplasmic adaptor subunit [Acidaminococcaceae bacterium]